MIPFEPDYRVAPGETIQEILEAREMSAGSFAREMGESPATVRALLDGTGRLTPEIAAKLERTLRVSAQFWVNLEANYRKPLP